MNQSLQDNYSVNLEVFHGPLDLLLYLIKKDEIDIYDIPIARITMQYMQYIEMMKILNLELAGEYILMAATLIRIKAKLLLPRDEFDGEEQDPRQELVAALLEYKKFKEAGEILREKRLLEERVYVPPTMGGDFNRKKVILSDSTTLYDMLTAFREVLERVGKDQFYEIEPEEMTVEDRIERVMDVLTSRESVTFQDLFSDIPSKLVAILTFLALLELARMHRISIRQSLPFSELRVYRGEFYDTPLPFLSREQPEETNNDLS
ncbi:MAG: segregation/condensation protein A [candidate division Zixibacteria bacterium]|nr:segregation/condensation protein A [candidate division Zixibacteria bacterium]